MKRWLCLFFLVTCAQLVHLYGQAHTAEKYFEFGGFVRHSSALDSRLTLPDNEGVSALFPLPPQLDPLGRDINARGQFNMLTLQTRLFTRLFAPPIGQARAQGYIEVDFQGRKNIAELVRMRKAYCAIDYHRFSVLAGQTDNPFFIAAYEPQTVTIDQGAPYNPFARNPQLRVAYNYGMWSIIGTAVTQLDKLSPGPDGVSNVYMRNAIIPNLDLQLQIKPNDQLFFATSANYKRLAPRIASIVDDQVFKVHESINSFSAFALAWCAIPHKQMLCATKLTYSQNMFEYDLLSGYAIRSRDAITGKQHYTNLANVAWWLDIEKQVRNWITVGCFVGFTKNLGFCHPVDDTLLINNAVPPELVFAREPSINYVMRIMPRTFWTIQQLRIGAELQLDHATFGTINKDGTICNTHGANLVRLHLALMYNF